MLSDLRVRVRALLCRSAVDAELDDELRAHLRHLTERFEARGVPREEAERRARLELGGFDQIKAECRDARGIGLVESVAHDLRYAARLLRKDATFTLIAVLTLTLGIGATTTIFSVVNTVLLQRLPYDGADRIVFPWRVPPPAADIGFDLLPWGRPDFVAFAAETQTFEHVGAFLGASFNLTGRGEPTRFDGARVSAGFFGALGVAPRLGRVFGADADRPGGAREVVLSDRLWREQFDAEPSIVGRDITIDGALYTVVGVMPAGFAFPQSAGMPSVFTLPREARLWLPLALDRGPRVRGEPNELAVVGRVRAGVTLAQAQSELDRFAEEMERERPQAKGWFHSRAVPMAEQLAGASRRPLLLLLAAVGVLLIIACANVANLLLARTFARLRELSLRAALGAARGRLIRQLTTEYLLLAAIGGGGGLLCARVGVDLVRRYGPATVPRLADTQIDAIVLLFAVALSLVSGLAFGLAPAWAASQEDLVASLKDGGRSTAGDRARLRSMLLVSEIALALVLVIASALLMRTFVHLTSADTGFTPEHALTFELTLPPTTYADADRIVALYRTALERLRSLPGVIAAGIGETVPMGGSGESTGLRIPNLPQTADLPPPYANYTIVSPGFFSAIGTPMLRGRDLLESDVADSPPVAIVSAAMARKYWPGQDAIGKQVGLPIRPFDMTVVGVVADVKHLSPRETPAPEIYVPYTQKPWPSMLTMHVVVRTASEPASIVGAVRQSVRGVDPELPIAAVATLDTIVDNAVAQPRFSMLLVSAFGGVSLLLACVGLYGAVSYAVASRTQELGIRIALGASKRQLSMLVIGESMRITLLGLAIGVALSLVALRTISSFLYGVDSTDPVTFATVSLVLIGVSTLACYVPARRALRVDPLVAMRAE